MNASFVVLLSFLVGGGSGDLLDYVQSQGYWDAHGVKITVDSMTHEATPPEAQDISKLIADLGAADPQTRDAASEKILKVGVGALPSLQDAARGTDPEVAERSEFLIRQLRPVVTQGAVRRLLALRALGELKDPRAIPFLQTQLASQEMFVGDYARAAIGRINNQPIVRTVSEKAINEVWMLPSNCRAVAQVIPRQTGPVKMTEAAAHFHPINGQDGATVLANVSRVALSVAESLGDMRLDSLNVGLSERIDSNHGCVTVIASGQFDAASAIRAVRGHNAAMRTVDGIDIFELGQEGAIFFPSDRELVLMIAPAGQELPLKEMIDAIKTRGQPLKTSPEMAALVQQMLIVPPKTPHALWMAAKVTDAYRQVPELSGFSALTLVGDETNDALSYAIRGECADEQAAAATSAQLDQFLAAAVAQVKGAQNMRPESQAALDFLGSVKFQSKGAAVTGTAQLSETPDAVLMRWMIVGKNGFPF